MNVAVATMQQYVDHSYNDFGMVDDDELRQLDENASLLPPAPADSNVASARDKLSRMGCTYGPMKKNSGGVVQPFPGKVSDIMQRQRAACCCCYYCCCGFFVYSLSRSPVPTTTLTLMSTYFAFHIN